MCMCVCLLTLAIQPLWQPGPASSSVQLPPLLPATLRCAQNPQRIIGRPSLPADNGVVAPPAVPASSPILRFCERLHPGSTSWQTRRTWRRDNSAVPCTTTTPLATGDLRPRWLTSSDHLVHNLSNMWAMCSSLWDHYMIFSHHGIGEVSSQRQEGYRV